MSANNGEIELKPASKKGKKYPDSERNIQRISDRVYDRATRAKIYQALNVTEKDDELLEVTDSDSRALMIHYVGSNPPDTVRHVRGYVVEKKSGRLVCATFPFTPEYTLEDCPEIEDPISCTVAQEGTIVRMYCIGDNMYVSTYKRLSCDFAWSGLTPYAELFKRKWGDESIPDVSRCYVFLIQDPMSRIAYPSTELRVFLVGVFKIEEGNKLRVYDLGGDQVPELADINTENIIINKPIKGIKSMKEAKEHLRRHNWKDVPQLLIWNTKGSILKLQQDEYKTRVLARGEEPNIYIGFIRASDRDREYIRELVPDIDMFMAAANEVFGKLKMLYRQRFVQHQRKNLPVAMYKFLEFAHNNRKEDDTDDSLMDNAIRTCDSRDLSIVLATVRINIK